MSLQPILDEQLEIGRKHVRMDRNRSVGSREAESFVPFSKSSLFACDPESPDAHLLASLELS
jgi:hypothetical protein